MTVKINYEKLKQALDALYEAIDYSGVHYVELKTECYDTTVIKMLGSYIEVPVEYLPVFALQLLMEFERVKNAIEIASKRFREGMWERL
jgi:hypothetical protein